MIKHDPNKITATMRLVVTGEFYDDEASEETLRYCIEQDLEDEGFEVDVSLLKEQEAVQPKTGHWIESKCFDECFWVCSECNFQSEAIAAPKLYKYCPNCGVKMKGR